MVPVEEPKEDEEDEEEEIEEEEIDDEAPPPICVHTIPTFDQDAFLQGKPLPDVRQSYPPPSTPVVAGAGFPNGRDDDSHLFLQPKLPVLAKFQRIMDYHREEGHRNPNLQPLTNAESGEHVEITNEYDNAGIVSHYICGKVVVDPVGEQYDISKLRRVVAVGDLVAVPKQFNLSRPELTQCGVVGEKIFIADISDFMS